MKPLAAAFAVLGLSLAVSASAAATDEGQTSPAVDFNKICADYTGPSAGIKKMDMSPESAKKAFQERVGGKGETEDYAADNYRFMRFTAGERSVFALLDEANGVGCAISGQTFQNNKP